MATQVVTNEARAVAAFGVMRKLPTEFGFRDRTAFDARVEQQARLSIERTHRRARVTAIRPTNSEGDVTGQPRKAFGLAVSTTSHTAEMSPGAVDAVSGALKK